MIPILYPETETQFKTNGLGGLADALTCTVTEERNGSYELKLTYPVEGIHFGEIQCQRIIWAQPSDGAEPQPFEIYSITKPISGKVTVKARHISYRLSYIVTLPGEEQKTAQDALVSLKSGAVTDCPFSFSSDVVTTATFRNTKPQSIRALLGGQTGSILDCFGGEYLFDKFSVKLLENRGSSIPVSLEYGKNITDLQQEENIGSTYTAVICYWQNQSTTGTVKTVYGDLVKTGNAENYPYVRTLSVDVTSEYQAEPTREALTKRAEAYIRANDVGVPKVSIKLSFVALWQTEEYKDIAPLQHIHLCDTIKVKFAKLGVDAHAKVVTATYNVLKERYDSLEIGDAKSTLAGTIAKQTSDLSVAEQKHTQRIWDAIARATEVIRGGSGGYVVIRPDEKTGYPDEILIMDQPDKDTAENVIRMNKNGIGFSLGKGYRGPFESAWTIDGGFNANFINTGKLDADLIKTGILKDVAESGNFWNMTTGEFQLSNTAKVGESTVASVKDVGDAVSAANTAAKELCDQVLKNSKDYTDTQKAALDDSFTQEKVFNRLTNDGVTKGVYLSDGDLFINADYIKSGTISGDVIKGGVLQDSAGNLIWNLESGALTAKKLSVDSTNFKLTEDGSMTAANADITGTFKTANLIFSGNSIYTPDGGYLRINGQITSLGSETRITSNTNVNGWNINLNGNSINIRSGANIYIGSQYGKNATVSIPESYSNVTGDIIASVSAGKKSVVTGLNYQRYYAISSFLMRQVQIPTGATFNKFNETVTLQWGGPYYVFSSYNFQTFDAITSITTGDVVSSVSTTKRTATQKSVGTSLGFTSGLLTS